MSGAAQILVKGQEPAQLLARRHFLARGRLVGDLLALPEGSGAVSGVGDSFSHFEDLAARRDQDVSSMNFLEILGVLPPTTAVPPARFSGWSGASAY